MLLKRSECNYKYGNIAVLKYHYESCHKDKTDKCMCGNIILSGICAEYFSPWGCSLKNESSSSSSSSSGSGSSSIYDSNSNSDPNTNPNPNPNPNPNLNPNFNPNSDPNHNSNLSPEVLIKSCNKCNYIKPLTDFEESKYTCRSCTSAKVYCPFCASVVRYDGIRAHVRKQHPDVDIPKGFSTNLRTDEVRGKPSSWGAKTEGPYPDLSEKTISPSWQSKTVSPLVISQTEESCSCKYYNFVSFLINNGINIEKVKENIILLKSIDNLK